MIFSNVNFPQLNIKPLFPNFKQFLLIFSTHKYFLTITFIAKNDLNYYLIITIFKPTFRPPKDKLNVLLFLL